MQSLNQAAIALSAAMAVAVPLAAGLAFASTKTLSASDIAVPFVRQSYFGRDSDGAYERFAATDFIQHNPEMADGLAARRAFFAQRQLEHPNVYPSPTSWGNVVDHVLVDRDLIAVHHHVFMSPADPGRVFFDIWRVANGRIVEHWDVIQPVPTHVKNENTMWCGRGLTLAEALRLGDTSAQASCGNPGVKSHRAAALATVRAYLKQMTSGDVAGAVRRWFAPDFRQHSPDLADGIEGTEAHLNGEYASTNPVRSRDTVSHIIAQGDLVLVHHLVIHRGETRGKVQADLFRVSQGKIAEHWDVKQDVPEGSVNGHTIW